MSLVQDLPLEEPEHRPFTPTEEIRVKNTTGVRALGKQIIGSLEVYPKIRVMAIGAGAFNQAIKGVVNARQMAGGHGEDLVVRPGFKTVYGLQDQEVSALVLNCSYN